MIYSEQKVAEAVNEIKTKALFALNKYLSIKKLFNKLAEIFEQINPRIN
jgi:hypothetical protein